MTILAKICRFIPIHIADLERTFFQLKLVKTRMTLLRIAIEGPAVSNFPVNETLGKEQK